MNLYRRLTASGKAADTVGEHGAGLTPERSKEDRMETTDGSTPAQMDYFQRDYGDHICGTKQQIQSLGIGVRTAFPGEPGAPKREVTTVDHRGFRVAIRPYRNNLFNAYIYFPGWPKPPVPWSAVAEAIAPGVTRSRDSWFDEYKGTASALIAAGVVRDEQIPGPGRARKVVARWLPDGRLCGRGAAGGHYPGEVHVSCEASKLVTVRITITHEEKARRDDAWRQAYAEWERRIADIPRPAKLEPLPQWQLNRLRERDPEPCHVVSNVVDLRAWRSARAA